MSFLSCALMDSALKTDELHREGERLMEALLDLETCNPDALSCATTSDGIRGVIGAELTIDADSLDASIAKSLVIVRTAIHTIGGRQPDWAVPQHPESSFEPKGLQLEMM